MFNKFDLYVRNIYIVTYVEHSRHRIVEPVHTRCRGDSRSVINRPAKLKIIPATDLWNHAYHTTISTRPPSEFPVHRNINKRYLRWDPWFWILGSQLMPSIVKIPNWISKVTTCYKIRTTMVFDRVDIAMLAPYSGVDPVQHVITWCFWFYWLEGASALLLLVIYVNGGNI